MYVTPVQPSRRECERSKWKRLSDAERIFGRNLEIVCSRVPCEESLVISRGQLMRRKLPKNDKNRQKGVTKINCGEVCHSKWPKIRYFSFFPILRMYD
jgi:hypothetical protein